MHLKPETSWAYGCFGHFKPLDKYDNKEGRLLEYSNGLHVKSTTLSDILHMDLALRTVVQRREYLEQMIRPLQQKECSNDGSKTLQGYKEESEELESVIPEVEKELYFAECQLPERPLKRIYDKIRRKPTWYLREELIKDCTRRGGCCGRSCQCCELRSQHGSKGIGHCTIQCRCCEVSRGVKIDRKEQEEIYTDLIELFRSEDPSYLLVLAEAYFCMPGMFAFGRSSVTRTIAWRWKKGGLWQWKRVSKWLK